MGASLMAGATAVSMARETKGSACIGDSAAGVAVSMASRLLGVTTVFNVSVGRIMAVGCSLSRTVMWVTVALEIAVEIANRIELVIDAKVACRAAADSSQKVETA